MVFKCVLCGKMIHHNKFRGHLLTIHGISSAEYYDKYILKDLQDKKCICGKNKKFKDIVNGYLCSCGDNSCTRKIQQQTLLEKYGVDSPAKDKNVQDKMKATSIAKYGVPHYTQTPQCKLDVREVYDKKREDGSLSKITEKRKHTCLAIYGVDNVFKNSQIIKKK
jgi:hypothetical protein